MATVCHLADILMQKFEIIRLVPSKRDIATKIAGFKFVRLSLMGNPCQQNIVCEICAHWLIMTYLFWIDESVGFPVVPDLDRINGSVNI